MEEKLLSRKISIILATIDVIDEFGISNLSTREVARRVGISEPAIFRHFKTKGDLLLAVLDHFANYDNDIMLSIKAKELRPLEAISFFIEVYATYYENYPAITAITQNYEVLRCDPYLSQKIQGIFSTRKNFMAEMIKKAQTDGEIIESANYEGLSTTIMGISREYCLSWRMNGYVFSLKERILSTINMILEAFKVKE